MLQSEQAEKGNCFKTTQFSPSRLGRRRRLSIPLKDKEWGAARSSRVGTFMGNWTRLESVWRTQQDVVQTTSFLSSPFFFIFSLFCQTLGRREGENPNSSISLKEFHPSKGIFSARPRAGVRE
ncbi:hypothetical protein AVEN_227160-1 [Araneus ventricosus]|uniref:Uncharacterized protein n=1 Tax=Araneus ventricosus TaxID=182803 RepID=A0A4Y2BX96_ARAVE|nr:hypothetical protein AVEN_227160-1 [Araneus ventricosus]